MAKIKVLIVDDSALVRQVLTKILDADPAIEVVGVAPDPLVARSKIKKLNPDVITLDVEMPRMDGLTFLGNVMRLRPMPVVMVSSLTEKGAEITMRALELGAVEIIAKPKVDVSHGLQAYADELLEKVKAAASAKVHALERSKQTAPVAPLGIQPKLSADAILGRKTGVRFRTTDTILAIGASTGGTEAIKEVLVRLPPDAPGTVIAQHIPGGFSTAFANRMNTLSAMTVCEAQDGQQIIPGHAYIAPGDQHLLVVRDGARYRCRLSDGPPVNRHKPSVDVLFRSVAQTAGPNAIGLILTGMGADGASGMLEMREAGAYTIAQDEKSSVVWGMPGEAVKLGAAVDVCPLLDVADRYLKALRDDPDRVAL
jgi:two-component system chemotaxis response regulator CheB